MVTLNDIAESKTVEIQIDGKISKEEYRTIAEHLRERIDVWGHVNLLEEVRSFDGFDPAALWENIKFGVEHIHDIGKCAIVSDKKWIRTISQVVDPITKIDIRTFTTEEMPTARAWLAN